MTQNRSNTSHTSNESSEETPQRTFTGIVIQGGYASGSVLLKPSGFPSVIEIAALNPQEELHRLHEGILGAVRALDLTLSSMEPDSEEYAIFSAHKLMLADPVLLKEVESLISTSQKTADFAWIQVMRGYYEQWKTTGVGSTMEQRSSDILDVALRVYRELVRETDSIMPRSGILVTKELSASDALTLDPRVVLGVISERGNETSHSAILVRSKGIPVLFGVKNLCDVLQESDWVAMDAEKGLVQVGYSAELEDEIKRKRSAYDQRSAYYARHYDDDALFGSGLVQLLANVSSPLEIPDAMKYGARGVGLFRTEFLYNNRPAAPDEQEQFEYYCEALTYVNGQTLVIRTADFGGDKPIAYLKQESETNPFLGLRGIRYSLREESLIKIQLRALLRASNHGKIDILFPMISTVEEVIRARDMIDLCRSELANEGIKTGVFRVGAMIEVPSAALVIESILMNVDFISIGTNDLIQYVMAADRTQDALRELTSSFQPAVLMLIEHLIKKATDMGKSVAICGEMAGQRELTSLLLAFGLREFSMTSNRIPSIKQRISELDPAQVYSILTKFRNCKTVLEVQQVLTEPSSVS